MEHLSVFVLSYDSFRTSKKEGRKAYQKKGNLVSFSKYLANKADLLVGTGETALIQVIRQLNSVVIVDESHHAISTLSIEMLRNFNPSFVLLQAEANMNENSTTYEKIERELVEMGIPEEEIEIKTADKDDIRNKDLMSRECLICYIITINALKEGWDCPFAYILATIANRSSHRKNLTVA